MLYKKISTFIHKITIFIFFFIKILLIETLKIVVKNSALYI